MSLLSNTAITMPNHYVPVSQEGSDVDEKDVNLFLPIQPTPKSARWSYSLIILAAALVGSICANIFLIYRQFVRPWELFDDLPTQFGTEYHPMSSV